MHDIWQEERRRVIEGRGKRSEPIPQRTVSELVIQDSIPNPIIQDSKSKPILQDNDTKLTAENEVLNSENSGTRHLSGVTKIKPIQNQNSGLCPKSTISTTCVAVSDAGFKRKFLFSDDKDLEDLDDNFDDLDQVPSKKCKIDKKVEQKASGMSSSENKVDEEESEKKLNRTVDDMSIFDIDPSQFDETETKNDDSLDTFCISQDTPVTSTQIEVSTKPKIVSSNDSGIKTASGVDSSISPLSIKTLSKLRAFAAPPKEENVEPSKTSLVDEGKGTSIVDKETFHIEKGSKISIDEGNGSSIVDKETFRIEKASKISIDEGNGSSIVDSKLSKDSPKEEIIKRSNVVDNSREFFQLKKPTTKAFDVERQRSLLASVFSDPFDDNLDDLDF